MLSNIGKRVYLFQVADQIEQLFILNLPSKGRYGHAIVQIEGERDDGIVNEDDVLKESVLYDS